MVNRTRTDFRLLRGWTGRLILRPWFDWCAHAAIMRWYFPLSRAWAAGLEAKRSVDAFAVALGPAAGRWSRAAAVLAKLDDARWHYEVACARWEAAFFGCGGKSADLAACEAARLKASAHLMTMRGAFLPIRGSVPRLAWAVAGPETAEAAHGARLTDPDVAYPAPSPLPAIEMSHPFEREGHVEHWLRVPSPSAWAGDIAWARVFRPARGPVRGTIVSLHGILMEQDMWTIADPVSDLVARGYCVMRPEGPWHGRRRTPGSFGGEPILARGILGFIELFEAWVSECAVWFAWARRETGGPVALAGISLGALTAQLIASYCGRWPAEMRPDAVMLVTTTGDIVDGAMRGSLAQSLRMPEHLAEAGWRRSDIHRWRALVEPGLSPAIDHRRVVIVLGEIDRITPYDGGRALAVRWAVPPENLFVRHGGHFSAALGLYRDPTPLERLAAIMEAMG